MKIKILIFLIFTINLYNQDKTNNNWLFSQNVGLNFNTPSGFPVPQYSEVLQAQTTSTISDENGNLLFYITRGWIYNKKHSPMLNGSRILNDAGEQPNLIVKMPGRNNIYYIFHLMLPDSSAKDTNGLRCSIVDMNLDNGLGAVTIKNKFLYGPVCDKLTGIQKKNSSEFWILSHLWKSNKFYAYKLTEEGLEETPMITEIGVVHEWGYRRDGIYKSTTGNSLGQMKFSHDGTRIAVAIRDTGYIELFDFDQETGKLSNPIQIKPDSGWWGCGSLEFSNDGSKLYVYYFWPLPSYLVQYDLSSNNSDSIRSSKLILDSNIAEPSTLQMGPDRRIYFGIPSNWYVSYIANPNGKGADCNYIRNGIYLNKQQVYGGIQNSLQGIFQINCSPESFDYPIFKKEYNLTLLKDSKLIGDAIRVSPNIVNQRGAVWHNRKVDVTKAFTCDFSMRFSKGDNIMFDDGSLPGADGLVFVIQNNDSLSIGDAGGGLGYNGIPNSIAVEFDLYWNKKDDIVPIDDPNGNHIAVQCNGTKPNTADHSTNALLGMAKDIQIIKSDSTLYYVRIKYEPDTLMVFMDTINYYVNPVLKIGNFRPERLLNLEEGKRAFIGFTSSTGASVQNNDIEEWYFCNQTAEIINDVAEEEKNISENVSQLSISPNPAREYIEVYLKNWSPSSRWTSSEIKIYNLFGECVVSAGGAGGTHPLIPSQEGNIRIDVSGLPAGVYFVRVADWVGRFVKI